MKRIAFLTSLDFDETSCPDGGRRHLLNLAVGVADGSGEQCEVEIISFGNTARRFPLQRGVWLRLLPNAYQPQNPADKLSWDMPEAIGAADLLHIYQAFCRCAEWGLVLARLHDLPICVTDYGTASSALGSHFGSLELADHVICQSDFGAARQQTRRPITVIKGGVDTRQFTPSPRPIARDRVLYVGRLLPHKGIDRLIQAMPSELPLTVCGRPHDPQYLQLLQSLAAGKRVDFVTDATDDDIRTLYRQAWVNVLPAVAKDCHGRSQHSPSLMGLTLLEAMSCGTPVICANLGGLPEFVIHGETGFVFHDLQQLTEHLRTLAADAGLVERMGRSARRLVEREYDLRVAGRKLLCVYDELLGGARRMAA